MQPFLVISDVTILHTNGKSFTNGTTLKGAQNNRQFTSLLSTLNRKERSEAYVGKGILL